MGYTSVGKCNHIEINRRFNLLHGRDWTGDTVSNICKRYGTSRKTYYKWNNRYKQKGIEGLLEGGINGLTPSEMFLQRLITSRKHTITKQKSVTHVGN
jgi:transposase-like protein